MKPASRDFGILRLGGDRENVEDGDRRLDHRPDPRLVVGAHIEQPAADHLEHFRVGDFRHQDGVGRGVGGGGEVVGVPGRIDAIDADEHLARAEAAGLDGVDDLLARRLLGVRRHRILEVEDDAVDGQGLRLFHRAGIGARHVKHAAARADGHAAQLYRPSGN